MCCVIKAPKETTRQWGYDLLFRLNETAVFSVTHKHFGFKHNLRIHTDTHSSSVHVHLSICLFCFIWVFAIAFVFSVCGNAQEAERLWHCISAVKHICVHSQLEAERRWYRWSERLWKTGSSSRLTISPTVTPVTRTHTPHLITPTSPSVLWTPK